MKSESQINSRKIINFFSFLEYKNHENDNKKLHVQESKATAQFPLQ